jgi:sugar (pentulose or hexulose) kinase
VTGSTRPDPVQVQAYQAQYPVFRALYPALKGFFQKM